MDLWNAACELLCAAARGPAAPLQTWVRTSRLHLEHAPQYGSFITHYSASLAGGPDHPTGDTVRSRCPRRSHRAPEDPHRSGGPLQPRGLHGMSDPVGRMPGPSNLRLPWVEIHPSDPLQAQVCSEPPMGTDWLPLFTSHQLLSVLRRVHFSPSPDLYFGVPVVTDTRYTDQRVKFTVSC